MKQIEILCKNSGRKCFYPMGITLEEIARDQGIKLKTRVCGALVNNKLKELSFTVVKSKSVEFIDMTHPDGRRMYIRSLLFIFYAAVNELFPEANMSIEHGISNGYYAEMKGMGRDLTKTDIFAIEQSMKEIIRKDYPFEKNGLPTEEAVVLLREQGLVNKARLFEQQGTLYSYVYRMNGLVNYFYGHLLPSTGYITNFGLELYYEGLLLKVPHPEDYRTLQDSLRQEKLFVVYQEHKDWAEILQVATIAELNGFTMNGKAGDIIKISEALHEKKVAEIANLISHRRDEVRIVLVAGPSSSGKTTFSKRLGVQLAVNGLWPHQISLDDYFVDREHTPRDENGEFDFEALEAIDINYL
jgi:uridine kinase